MQLMKKIRESIKFQESQKNKSITGLITSGIFRFLGVVSFFVTCNNVELVYGISSNVNVFSTIGYTTNIIEACKIIDEFNKVLDKAIEEEKIQDEIDRLISELTQRLEQLPKFDLHSAISSISTIND